MYGFNIQIYWIFQGQIHKSCAEILSMGEEVCFDIILNLWNSGNQPLVLKAHTES